jgi:hypothetical protein
MSLGPQRACDRGDGDRVIRLADDSITSIEQRQGAKLAPRELSW